MRNARPREANGFGLAADRAARLFSVIENFGVGEFWLGRNPMIPRYKDLIGRIQEKQIPIRWVYTGQTIGPFTVLHPPLTWVPRKNDQNNDSVVLLLDTGRISKFGVGFADSCVGPRSSR